MLHLRLVGIFRVGGGGGAIDDMQPQRRASNSMKGSPVMHAVPPPVPVNLKELLSEYPGHIERLQEVLDSVAERQGGAAAPFELAVWALEGRLESFLLEARRELEAAKATGDAELTAAAEAKARLMSQIARKHVWQTDEGLWEYFGK
jgi:hypothetical protein